MNRPQDVNPNQKPTAAEAVVASELRYRRLFESAKDGILILDAETGMVVDVNPFLSELLGFSHANLVGKKVWELGFLKDIIASEAHFAELQAKEYIRYEDLPLETAAGRRIDVEFVSNVYLVDHHKVIQCNIRDITARKQAEMALNTSQRLLEGILDAIPVRVFWKDKQLVYLGCNTTFARDAGFAEPKDIIGKDDFQMGWRKQAERYRADDRQVIDSGNAKLLIEELQTTPEGNIITLLSSKVPLRDQTGAVCGVLGTYLDITARKQTEAEVQLQGSALRAAANAIVITDKTGNIMSVNPSFTALTGYTVSEVLGKNPRVLKSGQHDAAFYRQLWETITAGKVWSGEVVNKRKDGSLYTEEMTITPVRDEHGAIANFIAIKQDITARKRVEADLQQAHQQIIEQEKLRVLGQMVSGIAHDFNNALSPILGFSELLLKHPEKLVDQSLVLQRLQIINICATDAAQTVRQMREFSRPRSARDVFQSFDLNQLVRQTIDLTQQRWKDQAQATGRTIHIVTDLLPILPIWGEESALREMLTNLIFNAVDALPAGGTITLGTMLDGRAVRLSVSDTGTGMTEETRRRCLEPFYTTKGTTGTGLGLAMVQGIVQRHNGTVDVESQFGHGTTFIIRLPLQKGTQPPSVPPLEVPALTRSRHVLVVDDEPLLRAIAETYLTEDGHKVETAPTGAVALAQLKTSKFDLVITDKAMPEMNGEQLAAAIHQIVPGLPVIMMTGFGDLMKVTGEMPPYISEILSKPLTQASLRAAMAKVVGVN